MDFSGVSSSSSSMSGMYHVFLSPADVDMILHLLHICAGQSVALLTEFVLVSGCLWTTLAILEQTNEKGA